MALDLTSVAEKNLARIHEWIRSVDQKLSILLTFQGVFIALVTPLVVGLFSRHLYGLNAIGVGFITVGYLSMAYGIFKAILALYSTLKVKKSKQLTEDQLSLTYFQHIDGISLETYEKRMFKLSKKEYIKELLAQTKVSATITTKKQIRFNDALFFFFSGAIILAGALVFLSYYLMME
jgi:hypothetical protein